MVNNSLTRRQISFRLQVFCSLSVNFRRLVEPISETALCLCGAEPIGAQNEPRFARGFIRKLMGIYGIRCKFLGSGDFMATAKLDEVKILEKAKQMLVPDYVPNDEEEYMSEKQLDYFRKLLLEWKRSIHQAADQTLQSLQDGPIREPDLNDRASSETDWSIELRTRDRQRKLISKIDSALRRIDGGEYGYCEVTGDPIGIMRLIARPVATMTVEAQEAHERKEKISRDD